MDLRDVISATREWVAMETKQQHDFGVRRPLPEGIRSLHDELRALMLVVDGTAERRGGGDRHADMLPLSEGNFDDQHSMIAEGMDAAEAADWSGGQELGARTLPEAIEVIMRSKDPIRIADLLRELNHGGKEVKRKPLENTLQRLTKEGRLGRIRPGVYTRSISSASSHETE